MKIFHPTPGGNQSRTGEKRNLGVITSITEPTDWVNALAFSRKASGGLRVSLDPRSLNQSVHQEDTPQDPYTGGVAPRCSARWMWSMATGQSSSTMSRQSSWPSTAPSDASGSRGFPSDLTSHRMHSSNAWIRSSVNAQVPLGSPTTSSSMARMTKTMTEISTTSWRLPRNVDLSSTLRNASSRHRRSSSLEWFTMLMTPLAPWPRKVHWNPSDPCSKECHRNSAVSWHHPVHGSIQPRACRPNCPSESSDQEGRAIWVEQLSAEGFWERQSLHLQGHCSHVLRRHQTSYHPGRRIMGDDR